ncbi:TPA: restriction endonuclease subunit S, partial [Klebsiella pneumoniae]|nr:restriction endonuclease subunit S [Klebsiella pneumoniae]HBW7309991.1 restriction endonuclease subunit S [Klebsiella pneumoniae]
MGSKWKTVRLGDYCIKIGSGATPKGGNSVYTDTGNTYFIRSQNVYNHGFNTNGLVFITDEAAFKLKNVDVQENDVLLNITGDSVARVCIAPGAFLPARVNQHVAIIRPKNDAFDPRFLRYFLSSPHQQTLLLTLASAGATRNA